MFHYIIFKHKPRFVIRKAYTATLTKVKVPVRLPTGATVMGYRYKQMGPEEVKQKSKLDSLHFERSDRPNFDVRVQMVVQDAVDPKLIGHEEYLWDGGPAGPDRDKLTEYNKHLKEVYFNDAVWGITNPSAQHIKKLGAEIGMDYWKDNKVRTAFDVSNHNVSGVKFGIRVVNPDIFQREWAQSANDSGKYSSDLLQAVMATHIPEDSYNGSEGVRIIFDRIAHNKIPSHPAYPAGGGWNPASEPVNQTLYDIEEETVRATDLFLASIYHRTQEILKGLGYAPDDTVILYRGVGASLNKLDDGSVYTNKDYKLNPLSSWSADPNVAKAFGSNIMVAEVRVRDIWSGFFTGMGCKDGN